MIAYFYVFKDTAGQWRWRCTASNGRTIADSAEAYHNLADCEHGISLIKSQAAGAPIIGDDAYKRLRG